MNNKYYDESDSKTLHRLRAGEVKIFTATLPERPAPGDTLIIVCRNNGQLTDFLECQIGTVTRAGLSAHAFLLSLLVSAESPRPEQVVTLKCRRPGLSTILADYRKYQHRAEIAEARLRVIKKAAVVVSIFKNTGGK